MGKLVALPLVLVAFALAAALVLQLRRPPAPVDPTLWRARSVEPWGTILLSSYLFVPGILRRSELTGPLPYIAALSAMVAFGALLVHGWRRRMGVRELVLLPEGLRVKIGRKVELLPYEQVLELSDLRDPSQPPKIHLADGRIIELPQGHRSRVVAGSLARVLGQTWNSPVLDGPVDPEGFDYPGTVTRPRLRHGTNNHGR